MNHTRKGAFAGIAPAPEESGRFRERHSDVGPPMRFHSLMKLILLGKHVGIKVENTRHRFTHLLVLHEVRS